jgi:uncharacterized protein (DUF1778 family)
MAAPAPRNDAEDRQTVSINLRVPRSQKDLIDRAAELAHKNRTQFILDAATHAAEDTLLDQRFFVLTGTKYAEFLNLLAEEPSSNARLADLMKRKAPWETT